MTAGHPPRGGRLLAGVLVLAGLTVLTTQAPARYLPGTDLALANLDFSAGSAGWHGSARGVTLRGRPPLLRLRGAAAGGLAWVGRPLPAAERVPALRVSAQMRAGGGGRDDAPGIAGLVLLSLDAHGRPLWYRPAVIGRLEGARGWRRYSRVIPVAGEAAAMQLVAYQAGAAGTLELRGLRLQATAERALFRVLRYVLALAWLAAGVLAAGVLLRGRRGRGARLATLALAALMVAGALLPQPYLRDTLRSALLGGREVLHALAELRTRPVPQPRLPGAGTPPAPSSSAPDRRAGGSPPAPAPGEAGPDGGYGLWENAHRRAHLAAFALLALLALLAWRRPGAGRVLLCVAAFAPCIEAMQSLTVTREAQLDDLVQDLAGIAAGALAARLVTAAARLAARRRPHRG